MDWLNDKKNQPIVIGILVLILAGAGIFIYMTQFAGSGSSDAASQETTAGATDRQPGMSPNTPPSPGGPAPSAAPSPTPSPTPAPTPAPAATPSPSSSATPSAAGNQVAGISPIESWRADPFLPVGYKPAPPKAKPKPRILIPVPEIVRWHPPTPVDGRDEYQGPPQPTRRMAGLLLNGRVYAIIETNGKTEIRQPGDRLNDGMAMVDRIERDKVILKTTSDKVPRYLTVRMAAATRQETGAAAGGGNIPPPGARTPYGPGAPPYGPGGGMPRGGMQP